MFTSGVPVITTLLPFTDASIHKSAPDVLVIVTPVAPPPRVSSIGTIASPSHKVWSLFGETELNSPSASTEIAPVSAVPLQFVLTFMG